MFTEKIYWYLGTKSCFDVKRVCFPDAKSEQKPRFKHFRRKQILQNIGADFHPPFSQSWRILRLAFKSPIATCNSPPPSLSHLANCFFAFWLFLVQVNLCVSLLISNSACSVDKHCSGFTGRFVLPSASDVCACLFTIVRRQFVLFKFYFCVLGCHLPAVTMGCWK